MASLKEINARAHQASINNPSIWQVDAGESFLCRRIASAFLKLRRRAQVLYQDRYTASTLHVIVHSFLLGWYLTGLLRAGRVRTLSSGWRATMSGWWCSKKCATAWGENNPDWFQTCCGSCILRVFSQNPAGSVCRCRSSASLGPTICHSLPSKPCQNKRSFNIPQSWWLGCLFR